MREKLATLPLTQLKELAKSQGIKNISGLRKAELIDRLCETAESADSQKAAAGNSENRKKTIKQRARLPASRNGQQETARREMTVQPAFMENARNPRGIQEASSRTWTAALRHTGSWR